MFVPPEIVRRVNGERVTVLGWGRAILLQIAHPLIGAGIADHSTFRRNPIAPLRRLRGTIDAMLALTFGDEAAARGAADRILAIHDRVHGRLSEKVGAYPAGTPYSAHDPSLLLWVHITLIDSVLRAHESIVAPLTPDESDTYVAAAGAGMARIGVPQDRMPVTLGELRTQIDAAIEDERLGVSETTRRVADALLNPSYRWVALPLVRLQRVIAIGTLPPAVRALYGYGWTAADEQRLDRVIATIRRMRATAPARLSRFAAARARS